MVSVGEARILEVVGSKDRASRMRKNQGARPLRSRLGDGERCGPHRMHFCTFWRPKTPMFQGLVE